MAPTELRIKDASGVARWMLASPRLVDGDHHGDRDVVIGLVDIDELVIERHAREEADARYRLLVEHASDVIYKSDLDGTIGQERIAHAALAKSPVGMAEQGMVNMIREAGKTPVQRDALYRVIREYPREVVAAKPAAVATA